MMLIHIILRNMVLTDVYTKQIIHYIYVLRNKSNKACYYYIINDAKYV